MQQVVFLSAACAGIPQGHQSVSEYQLQFVLLPPGATLIERISKCSLEQRMGAIAVVSLLTDELQREQISALKSRLPHLRIISNYAVGYNNIDVSAARELGVAVTNTPNVLGDATADLTLTLMLMVARRIWSSALELHQNGRFAGWSPDYGLGVDLNGKTLGIVGLGDIGSRVAARARAFGLRVVALQSMRSGPERTDGIPRLPENEFLNSIDVLSLHCPLTPQTQSWLNAERLSRLKRGAIVINTSRGDVVDEKALADALHSGHLFGAGLDVFCGEPVVSPVLRGVPNLIILPHLGSATLETRALMGGRVMQNIHALLMGTALPTQVNR